MAKSKVPKNLEVDGTPKLAARAKPSDKHEKAELNIEQATVASPRGTRHRAGDYFDFEGDDSPKEEHSSKSTVSKSKRKAQSSAADKAGKSRKKSGNLNVDDEEVIEEEPSSKLAAPKKQKKSKSTVADKPEKQKRRTDDLTVDGTSELAAKAKPTDKHEKPNLDIEQATVAAVEVEKLGKGEPKPGSKGKKAKATKDDGSKPAEVQAVKVGGKNKAKEPKAAKEDVTKKDKAETSKRSRKDTKKSAADEDDAPEAVASKPKKLKAAVKKTTVLEDSAAIDSDVAMDEGPLESLLESGKGKAREEQAGQSTEDEEARKGSKAAQKSIKEPKASKTKPLKATASATAAKATDSMTKKTKAEAEKVKKTAKAKAPSIETVAEAADTVKKQTKAGLDKAAKATKANIPSMETVSEAIDTTKKQTKTGAEKAKKALQDSAPSTETAAEVADSLKKQTKSGVDNLKRSVKSNAPSTETAAEVADVVKKEAKVAAEKAKKAVKPKPDGKGAKKTASADEESKPEAQKSKKRKASAADAEGVKANLLDPLSEHAQASAKKKQKQDKAKSKLLGDAVGSLISSAAEGANAARASLGGLASTLIGGATETLEGVVEGATDATESAKSAAIKTKGKGKAIAEDVAETLGKATVLEAPAGDGDDASSEYESDEESEPDDHTAALLAGFESDGDEAPVSGSGFEKGQNLPELPNAKATKKKLKDVKPDADEGTGVVYIGRIPHGFYEHEMREYFTQFGDINRLRLSRNKKTGASRHWAFIEFKSSGVAKIVADTMNNYLMFGHILKCKVVPKEQLHENVWKGADKRFKKVPWNQLEGKKHEVPVGREKWATRNENEEKRRESKKEKMKQIGYEFEAPPLKSVDQVPVKGTSKQDEGLETFEEERSLVTAGGDDKAEPVVISEEVKTKRTKKSTEGEVSEITNTLMQKTKRGLEVGDGEEGKVAKKAKKSKGTAA